MRLTPFELKAAIAELRQRRELERRRVEMICDEVRREVARVMQEPQRLAKAS